VPVEKRQEFLFKALGPAGLLLYVDVRDRVIENGDTDGDGSRPILSRDATQVRPKMLLHRTRNGSSAFFLAERVALEATRIGMGHENRPLSRR